MLQLTITHSRLTECNIGGIRAALLISFFILNGTHFKQALTQWISYLKWSVYSHALHRFLWLRGNPVGRHQVGWAHLEWMPPWHYSWIRSWWCCLPTDIWDPQCDCHDNQHGTVHKIGQAKNPLSQHRCACAQSQTYWLSQCLADNSTQVSPTTSWTVGPHGVGKHFNESKKVMQQACFLHLAWGGVRGYYRPYCYAYIVMWN